MKKTITAFLGAALAAAILVLPAGPTARAAGGDDCRASCEIQYKQCLRGCNGDTDCAARCQEAKSGCLARCR